MVQMRKSSQDQKSYHEMILKLLEIHAVFLSKVDDLDEIVKKKIGPKGDKPSKQEILDCVSEILTHKLLQSVIAPLIPEVHDGKDADPVDTQAIVQEVYKLIKPAKDGDPGKHGATPVRGIHYFTDEDKHEVANLAASIVRLSMSSDKKELDPTSILEAIEKLPADKRLSTKHIDGLEQTISALHNQTRKGYLHGAGITALMAGSNITLVRDANGNYTISSTGGGGNIIAVTDSGDHLNYIVASAFTKVVVDGATYRDGHGYTKTGALAFRLDSPLNQSDSGSDIYAE